LLQEIISESHEQLLDDIKNFVNNNVDATQNSIPTALVALGVNLPGLALVYSFYTILLDISSVCVTKPFV